MRLSAFLCLLFAFLPLLVSTLDGSDVTERTISASEGGVMRRSTVSTIITDIEDAASCAACEVRKYVFYIFSKEGVNLRCRG
jgi:sphingomyelin phosphodiesterase